MYYTSSGQGVGVHVTSQTMEVTVQLGTACASACDASQPPLCYYHISGKCATKQNRSMAMELQALAGPVNQQQKANTSPPMDLLPSRSR